MNPRPYEATSDEFPNLFLVFKEPENQFATSSYHAFKSVKFPKKQMSGFLDISKRAVFECTSRTFGRITSTQVDIFYKELYTF